MQLNLLRHRTGCGLCGLLVSLALALALSGCAGMRRVDVDVQASVGSVPAPAQARYRFERLPSQAQRPESGQLENHARTALAKVGWVDAGSDGGARYSVLPSVRVLSYLADPWGQPLASPRIGWFGSIGWGHHGNGLGIGLGMRFPPPTGYRIELSLLLRDLQSGLVVYEAQAVHDGPWSDTDQLLPALLDASLKDFPNPPAGVRRISSEVPR